MKLNKYNADFRRKVIDFQLPAVENLELRSVECGVPIEQAEDGSLYCPKCRRLLGEEPLAIYSGILMVLGPAELSARRRRKGPLGRKSERFR